MEDSFWGWLVVAGVISVALLLFLGAPGTIEDSSAGATVMTEAISEVDYAEPVPAAGEVVRSEPFVPAPCACDGPLTRLGKGCQGAAPLPCTGEFPCTPLTRPSDPCSAPQINRNTSPCIPECGFVQLHTTVAQPTCEAVTFHWSASKGMFLDPTVSDPLFYAPATCSPYGEDLRITLTVIDSDGRRYSDRILLHIINVR